MRLACLWLAALAAWSQAVPEKAPGARSTAPAPATKKKSAPAGAASAGRTPAAKPAPAASTAPAGSFRDLKFPPLRSIEIPQVETVTLPNGMRVYLLENHELPLVSGLALIRTGNLFDPPGKVGLATMTGTVLRTGGSRSTSGDQIDERLESIAASVESSIGETSGSVSFSTLAENTAEVLAVVRDLMVEPEFRQEKIDLAKTQLRASIQRRNDDPGSIAAREFEGTVYGRDNSYGWRLEYEHVNRIAREDLVAFHRRYFFPANIMFAVYGDFRSAEMKASLEKTFGAWKAQQPPVPEFPKVSGKPAPGIWFAEKADITQSSFQIGHLGGTLKDPDYAALDVMADILGGGFKSRLFTVVRSRLGYAYSIGADWAANYNHPGTFTISGSTKSGSTTETLEAIRKEVERLRTSEVTEEELTTAKQTNLNSFVFNFESRRQTLARLLTYEYHGYSKDFLFDYQKRIATVTRADVLRVAKQHLRPEALAYIVVGPSKDFLRPLDSLGLPVKPLDLSIPEPKSAEADAASKERGKRILARAQQAAGGIDHLARIQDLFQVAEVRLDPSAGGMKATQVNRWLAPSYFRQELQLPFGQITSFTDGTSGWIRTPQGEGAMVGPTLKQAQGSIFRSWVKLLLSDRDAERTVSATGDLTVEISDKEGRTTRMTLDAATGLPAQQEYIEGPAQVQEVWSNFKEVGGVKFPFTMVVNQAGRKFAEAEVKEMKVNTGISVEEIRKRPER